MKIKLNSSNQSKLRSVTAATQRGTTFYRCTIDQVIETLENIDANMWLQYVIKEYGWDAIDFKHNLFGSEIIDDVLYICKTDGYEIQINGEDVEPEFALEDYSIEELSAYIEDATDDIVRSSITTYELKPIDLDEVSLRLLELGNSFTDVVKSAQDADLIEK